MTKRVKILIVTRTFLPKEGGIEEYVYTRCLQDPSKVLVLTEDCLGASDFDKDQPFKIYRWPTSRILDSTLFGKLLKQCISMVSSFLMSIWLYRKYRYQYIEWGHGYDYPSLLMLSYFLPIRFFIYLHGNDLLCPLQNPLFKTFFSLTLSRATGVICNSSFTQDYLEKNLSVSSPIHIISPTVRPEKFGLSATDSLDHVLELGKMIRNQYGISDKAVIILSVGRLVRRKGFERVIQQLPALVVQQGLDVHYLICGRGPMEAELRELSVRLNISDRVHFLGYVSDSDLAKHYSACDIFSMLTFFDENAVSIEGFGIVYAEAGFFSKPVIASQVGGVVDAVHHLENGLLVDPEASSEELLKTLSQLCRDEALRNRLGKRGRLLSTRKPSYAVLYQQ